MEGMLHHALHREVHLKTSLTPRRCLGCTELCRAGKNGFGDVTVALSRWKKKRDGKRKRGKQSEEDENPAATVI